MIKKERFPLCIDLPINYSNFAHAYVSCLLQNEFMNFEMGSVAEVNVLYKLTRAPTVNLRQLLMSHSAHFSAYIRMPSTLHPKLSKLK